MISKKKIWAINFTVVSMILSAMLICQVSAMKAVGDIDVAYGTPVIDGTIKADEWAAAKTFTIDSSNAKAWSNKMAADFKAVIRTLWDKNGLYFAGEITDSTFRYSDDGGYNGDAFQISLDVGQVFASTTESRAIFYSFGCYKDTSLVQRQESKNDAVMKDGTNGLAIKTVKTDTGWRFELCFPFSMLLNDNKLKSGKDLTAAAGLKINAMFCYLDKDTAGTLLSAFGTTKSDESVAYDWGPKDHGATLTLKAEVAATTTAAAAKTTAAAGTKTTTSAPATADEKIMLCAVLLCASAAGMLTVSRKKIR